MNSKIFTHLKKVVAVLVITLLCSTSSTYAFSFGTQSGNGSSGFMKNLITKLFNNKDYELSDLKIDLEKMQNSGNIDLNKITDLINKLPNGTDKNILEYVKELAEKIIEIANSNKPTKDIDLTFITNWSKVKENIIACIRPVIEDDDVIKPSPPTFI